MVAWFICPYKRDTTAPHPTRYVAMDDFTATIIGDGGRWAETEVLGDNALVKVQASAATLQMLDSQPGFIRIPAEKLDDPLSSLTAQQKTRIRNKVLALGYTAEEIQTALGADIGAVTLGQLLRFIATRRRAPRYDAATDSIIMDGPEVLPMPIEIVDDNV